MFDPDEYTNRIHFMCCASEDDVGGPEAGKTWADLLEIPDDKVAILANDHDHLLLSHGLVSGRHVMLHRLISSVPVSIEPTLRRLGFYFLFTIDKGASKTWQGAFK